MLCHPPTGLFVFITVLVKQIFYFFCFVVCCLLGVKVLLGCFLLTCGFPDDLKCLGKRKNESVPHQIHYQITPDIKDQIQHCEAQWLVKVIILCLKTACSYKDLMNYALFCFPTFHHCSFLIRKRWWDCTMAICDLSSP